MSGLPKQCNSCGGFCGVKCLYNSLRHYRSVFTIGAAAMYNGKKRLVKSLPVRLPSGCIVVELHGLAATVNVDDCQRVP